METLLSWTCLLLFLRSQNGCPAYRYHRFMIADTFKNDPEHCQCLCPGCTFGQLHDSGGKAPLARCPDCGFRTCYVHSIPWHEGQTCSEYTYQSGRGDERRQVEEASGAAIAKISIGRKCRHEFCWKCLPPYDRILAHGNSKHRKDYSYHTENISRRDTARGAL